MAFAAPLPADISDAYYDDLGRPFYLSADKLAGDYASVRFERELHLLRRFCDRGPVLDVGCSTGAFLHQLRARFGGDYDARGIEVSRAALGYAREQGLEVIDASLLTHDFAGRQFAAITFWAVLEHLVDPAAFVRTAARLLRPGGHCFALVPNRRALAFRWLGARYRYVLPQHLNYFDAASLGRLIRDAGLEVVAEGGSHFNPLVIWQDWRRGSEALVPDADRAALLARTTRWKQSLLGRPARVLVGWVEKGLAAAGLADNLWVVGRKP